MHISSLKISNYKSFRSSDAISLSKGFNIVVGKNNSGKTALLEAVGNKVTNVPHKSPKTVTVPQDSPPQGSIAELEVFFKEEEVEKSLIKRGDLVEIPNVKKSNKKSYEKLKNEGIRIEFNVRGESIRPKEKSKDSVRVQVDKDKKSIEFETGGGSVKDYSVILSNEVERRNYHFDAERLNVGKCNIGESRILNNDSSNLAEVITNLNINNSARYERYVDRVREVIPSVKYVSSRVIDDGRRVEVRVWMVEKETERSDLSVPLSECGTGVGQVLALLYVVMNADEPRVITVDEPQSFLHPGAVRRLIGIMKQHPQHQYVMSTHAPSVINATNPDTLLLTELNGVESKVTRLDTSETKDQRRFLSEVGARLSDVFGADNILWVEGRTEEECFPMILERVAEEPLHGTQILGVRQTGDLEGRQAAEAFEIYEKLSEGRGLRPPAVGFIFDREDRSDEELDDLRRRDDEKIRFIDRRMYEDYLLHPEAISAVLTELDGSGEEHTSEEVEAWMEENAADYDTDHEFGTDQWYAEVHAANLLNDLFNELTNARVNYEKVSHGAKLTEWLIDNEPDVLTELAKLLTEVLGREEAELA
jgi:AAA15 family ATPase/GTPase